MSLCYCVPLIKLSLCLFIQGLKDDCLIRSVLVYVLLKQNQMENPKANVFILDNWLEHFIDMINMKTAAVNLIERTNSQKRCTVVNCFQTSVEVCKNASNAALCNIATQTVPCQCHHCAENRPYPNIIWPVKVSFHWTTVETDRLQTVIVPTK